MKLTVYIDILVFINIVINYFLLKITALCSGITAGVKNLILSAVTGALFSVFIFFDFNYLLSFGIKVVSVLICTFIAFGFKSKRYFIKNSLNLTVANCIFTGFLTAFLKDTNFVYINKMFYYININPVMLVTVAAVVYGVISAIDFLSGINTKKNNFLFEITFSGKTAQINAFYDTGFKVKDLVSGKAVMLCSLRQIKNILNDSTYEKIVRYLAGDITVQGITPVFYSDISSSGVLPGLKPDRVTYKNKEIKNTLIAFTDKDFSDGVGLIFGKEIFNMTGE